METYASTAKTEFRRSRGFGSTASVADAITALALGEAWCGVVVCSSGLRVEGSHCLGRVQNEDGRRRDGEIEL